MEICANTYVYERNRIYIQTHYINIPKQNEVNNQNNLFLGITQAIFFQSYNYIGRTEIACVLQPPSRNIL